MYHESSAINFSFITVFGIKLIFFFSGLGGVDELPSSVLFCHTTQSISSSRSPVNTLVVVRQVSLYLSFLRSFTCQLIISLASSLQGRVDHQTPTWRAPSFPQALYPFPLRSFTFLLEFLKGPSTLSGSARRHCQAEAIFLPFNVFLPLLPACTAL